MGSIARVWGGLQRLRAEPRSARLSVYQYWDAAQPPVEVAVHLDAMREAVAGWDWRLLDEAAAASLIERRCGVREAAAFRTCKPPAMQADYLRLCLMNALGGVYLDADNLPLRPLRPLLERAPVALLPIWNGVVGTDTMVFRRPGHPFVRACLELATENIEHRRFDSVLMATGPAVLTAMRCVGDRACEAQIQHLVEHSPWNREDWCFLSRRAAALKSADPAVAASLAEMTFVPVEEMVTWVASPPMTYKTTSRHWMHWAEALYR
jgi:hypothetical protein